ncbi:hypothetical protein Bca52824_083489 [Brassica carinata]|uniref:Uncharacterized protein n=1 Tax=Brassica carinata TaxID=52824 RepID=A0A8X7PMG5_BRACI|nr:hypothetical protein Bca52824_083489 [Brassica carinata]
MGSDYSKAAGASVEWLLKEREKYQRDLAIRSEKKSLSIRVEEAWEASHMSIGGISITVIAIVDWLKLSEVNKTRRGTLFLFPVKENGTRLQLQPALFIIRLSGHNLLSWPAQIYADETDSSNRNAMPDQYPRQPEADDGIPTTCYCGAQPVLGCSYTPKDPYRRQLSDLKKTVDESEQKHLNLEKTVDELLKKKARIKLMACLLVLIGLVLVILRGIVAKVSKESGVRLNYL